MSAEAPLNRTLPVLILAVLLISGCATLSESQCMAGDWETVGYRDGLAGKQSAELLDHQNACVRHGVIPDRTEYLAGWEDGVRQFCQPNNGFAVGESGRDFVSVCPQGMQDAFYEAYQEGRRLHLAEAEIEAVNRQISQKEYRLEQLDAELADTEAELIADDTSKFDRVHLLDRTRALASRQGELEAEIQALRVDAALKRERLNDLRQTLAYAY